MTSPNKMIFEMLKQIAETMVRTFGNNCEIAIHDLENLDASLIHIAGNVTGRKPGAPITNLVVRAIQEHGDLAEDIANYRTTTQKGRQLKSSTAFIRNAGGKIIGAFCINFDVTDYLNVVSLMQGFARTEETGPSNRETFACSPEDTIRSLIEDAIEHVGKQPATLTRDERLTFVSRLEASGVFSIKGGVDYTAGVLGVSRHTVYNDIKKGRSQKS